MATPNAETGKRQTGKQKAAAAKAAANKPEKEATPKPKKETGMALIEISAKAMQKTLGPQIVQGLVKTNTDIEKAQETLRMADQKRYDLLGQTVLAIHTLYREDKQVDPAAAFSADKKAKQALNDRILIALGIREQVNVSKNDTPKYRLQYTKEVAKFFPGPKDPKGDPATVRKATTRSNLIHMITKAAQAATSALDKKVNLEMDKEAQTLRISGPAVKEAFGEAEVVLNEKQTIQKDGTAHQLTQRPSYQALANLGAAAHGVPTKTGSNDRTNKAVTNPVDAIVSLSDTYVKAVSRLGDKIDDKARTAMESVRNAIDKALD